MQGLTAAEHSGECLDGHADNVVFWLLRGERAAGGLRVEAQQQRARITGVKALAHELGPKPPGRAILCDFLEQVVVCVEEERKLRPDAIYGQTGSERGLDVG